MVRTNLWFYDGWNPICEICYQPSGITTQEWTHGLDLSGTLQGAGGIGGFLAWTRSSYSNAFLYFGDANGNITELVNVSNPTNIAARYQWDAYGDSITVSGPEAENNAFRWSSKYVIVQTGDKDFGYRILRDHRWLSRDPIGEVGGMNVYGFIKNSPVNFIDKHGYSMVPAKKDFPIPPGSDNFSCPPSSKSPTFNVICCSPSKDDIVIITFLLASLQEKVVSEQNDGLKYRVTFVNYWHGLVCSYVKRMICDNLTTAHYEMIFADEHRGWFEGRDESH